MTRRIGGHLTVRDPYMASVTSRTANWRLFGGSALLIAAILWLLATVTSIGWLLALAWLVLAAGLVIIAFGQTGGNGAVGKYTLGRAALVIFAAGWVLLAINIVVPLGAVIVAFAAIFIIVGGLVSAWAIYRKAVAKGAARWIMFIPAVLSTIWALGLLSPSLALPSWIGYLVAIAFGVAGALYLLNDRKIG
jgi:hypothetical protein